MLLERDRADDLAGPTLASVDMAELLVTIRSRVLRLLGRRGVIDTTLDLPLLPADEADANPVLAQFATAAVSGTAPAGFVQE